MKAPVSLKYFNDDKISKISPLEIFDSFSQSKNIKLAYWKRRAANNKIKSCFLLVLDNRAMPHFLPLLCHSKVLPVVLCAQNQTVQNNLTLIKDTTIFPNAASFYKCLDGSYISIIFVCNGKDECTPNADDEINCTCELNGKNCQR